MRPKQVYFDSYAKEQIIMATLHLMEHNAFDEITILQIAQEAKVARRTFYLYYNTKIDILNDYYTVLTKEYDDNLSGNDSNGEDSAVSFFTFWLRHREYLELLLRHDLFYILVSRFNDYLLKVTHAGSSKERVKYHSVFYAGGLWALLFAWTRDGFRESPEELAAVADRYLKDMLTASGEIIS